MRHDPFLLFRLDSPNAIMPNRAHWNDVGYDLFAISEFTVFVGQSAVIDTGVIVTPPEGYYTRIETRSSFAQKGLIVAGGIIDPAYTGTIKVVLWNISGQPIRIEARHAIAQLVVSPFWTGKVRGIDPYDDPANIRLVSIVENEPDGGRVAKVRGNAGFGSTDNMRKPDGK